MSLAEAFQRQAPHCADLGSDFTARLCLLLADNLDTDCAVGERMHEWSADPSHRADAVPLRLAGALHSLVLTKTDTGLMAVYPPNHIGTSDAALWGAVDQALHTHEAFILDWLKSPPQTNEVRRCNGLIPAFHMLVDETGLPLVTSEIGASGGLNLNWDKFAMEIEGQVWGDPTSPVRLNPDWSGPLPPHAEINVINREGCDLNPLDPTNPDDRLRLRSYIWADQTDRLKRTDHAISLATDRVKKEDALDFLRRRLAEPHEGTLHVIYHSIMWQYLPDEAKEEGTRIIHAAGEKATSTAPLAWLQFEGDMNGEGAGITLTTWPGGKNQELGRADFHGRWVRWNKMETLY